VAEAHRAEQAAHVAYIIKEATVRALETIEPSSDAVDAYTEMVRSGPANKTLLAFYSSCTPGYYNGESQASKADDLFFGNRYSGGAVAQHEAYDIRRGREGI